MSDYLAVGGVSAVLQSMLTLALSSGGPSALLGSSSPGVTVLAPDLISTGADEPPQLNLFMYYVSVNPALRNLDLPSSNGSGTPISNPPLAVNLHYLITAYGSRAFDPEILLGWAMKVFHDTPVVPPSTIQTALTNLASQSTTEAALVAQSTLAEQVEHLRITPETLTTEEIYRLWAAFQAAYRPSTAFQVSVVVIQDTDSYTSNLPVQTPSVSVQTLEAPVITSITPNPASAGAPLTIAGTNFIVGSGSELAVSFDGQQGIAPTSVTPSAITVTLPAGLEAGTVSVRIQRQVDFPDGPRSGFQSSPTPFQLIPMITNTPPINGAPGATLELGISPDVGQQQQVTLYVGNTAIPLDQRPVDGPATASSLDFPIPSTLAAGSYPLVLEVDGVQSALTPSGAGFTPQVVIS